MINKIINYFKEKVKLTKLDRDKLEKAFPKQPKSTTENGVIVLRSKYSKYIVDEDYKSCSLTDFKKILDKDFTNWKVYHKDYDCDNFAFKLHSNIKNKYPTISVGIVLSDSHAFNIFIDKYGKAYYIEPQSDKIYSYSQLTKLYKPLRLIII